MINQTSHPIGRSGRTVAAIVPAIAFALAGACLHSPPSHAAGMSTHAFMADYGRKALPEGPLKALLTVHRPTLIAGALNPDGGYGSGAAFPSDREMAERSHWGDFTDSFIKYLRTKTTCPAEARAYVSNYVVTNTTGVFNPVGLSEKCGRLIAYLFGNAAHGLTDESWDVLFEPNVRERNEDPNPFAFINNQKVFGPFTPGPQLKTAIGEEGYGQLSNLFGATPLNALEYAGDIIGITDHFIWADTPIIETPPTADLVEVHKINRPKQGVTAEAIERAHLVARSAVLAERSGAAVEAVRIKNQLPWLANNYFTGPGGVVDSGTMVSAMYQQWWEELIEDANNPVTTPFIAGVHPRNGARNVSRLKTSAGLNIAAFTGRNVKPSSVSPQTFVLLDEDGNRVPGETKVGIYNPDFTHLMRFFPKDDLKPNHTYTVIVSAAVQDTRDRKLGKAHTWRFMTGK